MIDDSFLAILQCPESHRPLRLADTELLDRLNRAIADGRVKNRLGNAIDRRLTAGLVRDDGMLLYPVVDDIPVLLADEAIPLEPIQKPLTERGTGPCCPED
jgi:uncharacterized protein YbaR (Trm112 family)